MTKRKKAMYPSHREGDFQFMGFDGPPSDPKATARFMEEYGLDKIVPEPVPSIQATDAQIAFIAGALQGLISHRALCLIPALIVGSKDNQVVGMLALAKLIKEGRS